MQYLENGWSYSEVDENLGLVVLCTVLCRVLFMSDSLSSVWGHSVHFAKCLMLTFSKGCCSLSFNCNQTLEKVCNLGKYRSLIFRVICQILSILPFEEKLPQLHCHYPQSYIIFIWRKVKESIKAPRNLVNTLIWTFQCYSMSNVVVSLDSPFMAS